ncbi:MAG: hypothetical protein D6696_13165, partial [Acidobacteria bacterium]
AAGPLAAQEDDATAADERAAGAGEQALTAGTGAGGAATRYQFRLYPHRRVGYRLRGDVGLRLPPLQPLFSPLTLDFLDLERPPGPQVALALELDLQAASGERSAKAQEFRDLEDGPVAGLDLERRGATSSLRLTGRHLGREDQDARLELRRYGQLKAELFYNQIPHNFAFDARSLYAGIGSDALLIDDAIQADLQASRDAADAARRLQGFVDGAGRHDLSLRRDRLGLAFDWTAFDPVAVEVLVNHESRRGVRPWSASFGLGNLVEIPWPVDYDASDVRLRAEYAGAGLFVDGTYRIADFDNNAGTVLFDNPFRIADSSLPIAIVSTFASGPAQGLIDLYPDNQQQELTFNLVKRGLPKKTQIQATVTAGRLEQDDPLLPFTTNAAVVPGAAGNPPFDASDPANRPAARAGARLDTRLLHLRLSSQLTPRLRIKATLRDYELDNETARITIPGFVLEDTTFRRSTSTTGGFTNLPIAFARRTAGLELALRLAAATTLTLSYEDERLERDFREVATSDESRTTVSLDARPASWVDLRLSYLVADRDAGDYDVAQFFRNQGIAELPVLPFLRKFDQASRDRDRLQLMASFYPTGDLVLGAQLIAGEDDYPESQFGVLDDEHAIYQLDLAWTASDRLSLFAAYGRERYDVSMRGRQWFPFGPSDPFRNETGFASNSNWTAASTDNIDTWSAGLDATLIPDRLRFELAWSRAETDGELRFASPLGTPADDLNPFVPAPFTNVDDVIYYHLNPQLEYRLGEHLSLAVAYLREVYDVDDFNLDGFRLVPVTAGGAFNGALLMGTLFDDFELEIWNLKLKWRP